MSDHPVPYDSKEESNTRSEQAGADTVPLEIDAYGVKLKTELRPRPPSGPDPTSWKEVWGTVNRHLMAFVSNFFGCFPDAVKALRSVTRGLGAFPGAVAERVGRAHQIADRQEDDLQVQARVVEPISAEQALENAERVFASLQAKGAKIALHQLPNGQWAIVAVRPELQSAAEQLMLEAPAQPLEITENLMFSERAEAVVVKANPSGPPSGEADMTDADIAEAVREDDDGGLGGSLG